MPQLLDAIMPISPRPEVIFVSGAGSWLTDANGRRYVEGDPPEGHQYSQFCCRYRDWQDKLDLVLRQAHHSGEKRYVDCAGQTVAIQVSRFTGIRT